ncbi:MAG: glycosyltransferase family 2 protein [Bryobacterales bacterium]|nr:glycosyltransferase family 2 protein [Bryobacterales bacterium]
MAESDVPAAQAVRCQEVEVNVSAIVPVWNGRELLAKLLDSLSRQTRPAAEVLVIDNGSTDGAPELATAWGARVVRMGGNAGFAAAVNRGVAESRSEWLAILNSDVELAPDWIEKLTAEPETWFATGKILIAARPDRIDGTWDVACRSGCAWRAGQGRPDGPLFSGKREIAMAPLTAVMARAELFRRIGPLDVRFESYLEDVDFGLRCAAAGLRGSFVPAAVCHHRGSGALGKWHAGVVRLMARNQVFLVAKHFPRGLRRRWWWPIFVGQGFWGLIALRHGAGLAWFRGKIEGIRRFRSFEAPSGHSRVEACVLEGEREMFAIQTAIGFDLYWRCYFALVGHSDTGRTHE